MTTPEVRFGPDGLAPAVIQDVTDGHKIGTTHWGDPQTDGTPIGMAGGLARAGVRFGLA